MLDGFYHTTTVYFYYSSVACTKHHLSDGLIVDLGFSLASLHLYFADYSCLLGENTISLTGRRGGLCADNVLLVNATKLQA